MQLDQLLQQRLQARREASLYRQRGLTDSPQGPVRKLAGQSFLNFSSNDYLGLAADTRIADAMIHAVRTQGVGSGASHLTAGHTQAHQQLEDALAVFTGRERALVFGCGYMANLGVITALMASGDAVFQDRLNHASLLDAGRLSGARFSRFGHLDYALLDAQLHRSRANHQLVVTDGVFSMDGDQADLPRLADVCDAHQAWLMVDDAHGFGVLGELGGGCAEVSGLLPTRVPILVGTLGKAFGTAGAFVAGSEALIETLIQFARTYIYTTALPPALAEATCLSLQLVQTEHWRRQRLAELIAQFRQGCAEAGLPLMSSATPIQPLLVGDSQRALQVSDVLRQQGIWVSAIRPPTVPVGSARLRVTLTASHTAEQVNQLLQALTSAWETVNAEY
ncbi:MAG: 8-amino-7-oxononanoate synthase [Nitrincola lacisaponensis]|uniref:8-amino-7-oxononanoate synthase n=1 Tax=Nitrincola lacisaponensis TaxID=267850 RepID=UPI00391A9449